MATQIDLPVNETRKLVFEAVLALVPLVGLAIGAGAAYYFAYRSDLPDFERVATTFLCAFGGLGISICLAILAFWVLCKIDRRHAILAVQSLFFDPA